MNESNHKIYCNYNVKSEAHASDKTYKFNYPKTKQSSTSLSTNAHEESKQIKKLKMNTAVLSQQSHNISDDELSRPKKRNCKHNEKMPATILPNIYTSSKPTEAVIVTTENRTHIDNLQLKKKQIQVPTTCLSQQIQANNTNHSVPKVRGRKRNADINTKTTPYVNIQPKPNLHDINIHPSNESKHKQNSSASKRLKKIIDKDNGLDEWYVRNWPLVANIEMASTSEVEWATKHFPLLPNNTKIRQCISNWCKNQKLENYQIKTCFVCGQRKFPHELKQDNINNKALNYMRQKLDKTERLL